MSVRPVKVLPQSRVRSHLKEVLKIVNHQGHHVLMTRHGKPTGAIISHSDVQVLWQLQERPVKEMEKKLRDNYARWLKAKRLAEEGWEGMDLDDRRWVPFWCFKEM